MPAVSLSNEAIRVLRSVSERAMVGYELLAASQLNPAGLEEAARELLDQGLINVKGVLSTEKIGAAYFYVPPGSKVSTELLSRLAR